jgi:PTS system ascorbate-specific IIA component
LKLTHDGVPLTLPRVQFTDAALPWRAAIRRAAEPLVRDGAVTPSYPEAAIAAVEQWGPYCDLGQGIAMPHARPEAGVNEIAVSFLRCWRPVLLADDADHPVEVFLMLAATDSAAHLDVVSRLAQVLMDDQAVRRLKAATTADAVQAVFASPPADHPQGNAARESTEERYGQ